MHFKLYKTIKFERIFFSLEPFLESLQGIRVKYNSFSIPITSTTAKPNVSSKSLEEDFSAAFNTGVDSSRNKTNTTSSLEKTLSRWDSPTTLKKI